MLLEKYTPKTLDEFIGNKDKINETILSLKKGGNVLILGQTGTGKTLAARLIAKELCYECIEFHLSDSSFKEIKQHIISSSQSSFGKKKLIIIDEIELLETRKFSDILELNTPIVLIANEYSRHITYLRNYFHIVKFSKPRYDMIFKFLLDVCKKEGIKYEDNALLQLSRSCGGDIRSALIDLETLDEITGKNIRTLSNREKEDDVFNTLKILFKSTSLSNSLHAINQSDKTTEEIFLWVEENIPEEFSDSKDIADAYNYLSLIDIYSSRIIKRQSYSLQKYTPSFLSSATLNKGSRGFVKYSFPKMLSKNKSVEGIKAKISEKLRISKKKSNQYMMLLKFLSKNKKVMNAFEFTEEEVKMLKKL